MGVALQIEGLKCIVEDVREGLLCLADIEFRIAKIEVCDLKK